MRITSVGITVLVLSLTMSLAADKAPSDMTAEELGAAIADAAANADYERYQELIKVALEKFPGHPATVVYTFPEVMYKGDYAKALEIVTAAAELDPTNFEWFTNKGRILVELGRLDEAEEALLKSIEMGETAPVTYLYLGYIEVRKEEPDLDGAAGYLEKGLADVPPGSEGTLLEPFYDLASVKARIGDVDAAIANLQRVLNVDPFLIEEAAEDPNLVNVRGDPRYAEMAARAEEEMAKLVAEYATVAPGTPAPDFVLKDTAGNEVRLADYTGKLVLLNVWATWCAPCRTEIPDIAAVYDEYKDRGDVVVLGISVDEITDEFTVEDLAAASAEMGVNYPVLLGDEAVVDAYISKAGGIPETYIIGPDGVVKDFIYGMTDKKTLDNKIKKYLPE